MKTVGNVKLWHIFERKFLVFLSGLHSLLASVMMLCIMHTHTRHVAKILLNDGSFDKSLVVENNRIENVFIIYSINRRPGSLALSDLNNVNENCFKFYLIQFYLIQFPVVNGASCTSFCTSWEKRTLSENAAFQEICRLGQHVKTAGPLQNSSIFF